MRMTRVLVKRLKPSVIYAMYLITVTLVLITCLELGFFILARAHFPEKPAANADGTGYANATEMLEIRQEERQCRLGLAKYVPYVEWAGRTYTGQYVNIDKESLRRTINVSCNKPRTLHVYGGSSVWGMGVSDADTIPSWLAKTISQKKTGCWYVENFGERAYVSSQDLNRFVSNVRRGNIPDVAIFHGGINDAIAAHVHLPPSYPFFYESFSERIDAYNNSRRALVLRLVKASLIYQEIRSAVLYFRKPDLSPLDTDLMHQSVRTYIENLRIAKIIGDAYGIKTIFLLQPTVYTTNKTLTVAEHEAIAGEDRALVESVRHFYSMSINQAHDVGLVDLSSIFDGWHTGAFLDFCHLTPLGNQEVA